VSKQPKATSAQAEYESLHDAVTGYISWDGTVDAYSACPFGSKSSCALGSCADSAIAFTGKGSFSDCPRFGGAAPGAVRASVLCRGKRWFESKGEPEPKEVGSKWTKTNAARKP